MTTVYPSQEVHRHQCPTCMRRVVCALAVCDAPESVQLACFRCNVLIWGVPIKDGAATKPPSKRHQRSVAAGQESEYLWERCHNACLTAKIARVWKIPTPTKKGKDGRLIYTRKSTVDYMGFTHTGRAIVAEAKSAIDGQFFASDFEEHQRKMLDDALADHALVLALLARDGKLRAVPWVDVRDAKGFRFGDVGFPVDAGEAYLRRWV